MAFDLKEMLTNLYKTPRDPHVKKSFSPTDCKKNALDLYLKWKNVPETNSMDYKTSVGLGMRTRFEESLVSDLKRLDILVEPPDGKQHRVEMERNGLRITGYMDAIIKNQANNQFPFECKTSYGRWWQEDLENGNPHLNYLMQLSCYMDFMDAELGFLVQAHFNDGFLLDTVYQFDIKNLGDGNFTMGKHIWNIYDEYARWKGIYDNYVVKDIEPPSDYIYKYPVEDIEALIISGKVKKSKLQDAYRGNCIIGDSEVIYSNYKDYIVMKEAKSKGMSYSDYQQYTESEKELLKGLFNKHFKQ